MSINRRPLFAGRTTAEEFHAQFAFPRNARCVGCEFAVVDLVALEAAAEAVGERAGDPVRFVLSGKNFARALAGNRTLVRYRYQATP